MKEDKPATGILWWKPKQWKKAKKISADSHVFDNTYREWKESAEETLKKFRDRGITVYKVEIDLDELEQWCKNENIPLDSQARSRFVSEKVKDHHESQID